MHKARSLRRLYKPRLVCARSESTAAALKPRPTPDPQEDEDFTIPAPNLSKWSTPKPKSPPVSPANKWLQTTNARPGPSSSSSSSGNLSNRTARPRQQPAADVSKASSWAELRGEQTNVRDRRADPKSSRETRSSRVSDTRTSQFGIRPRADASLLEVPRSRDVSWQSDALASTSKDARQSAPHQAPSDRGQSKTGDKRSAFAKERGEREPIIRDSGNRGAAVSPHDPDPATLQEQLASDEDELPVELLSTGAVAAELNIWDDTATSLGKGKGKSRLLGEPAKKKGRVSFLAEDEEPAWAKKGRQAKSASATLGQARPKKAKAAEPAKVEVYIPSMISVGNLATLLRVRLEWLQDRMRSAGMSEESSYDHVLTSDYAALLAEEFGRKPIVSDNAAFDIYPLPPHSDPTSLPPRPPIVTIMGHVDHGKTTLLDTLRSASVAAGEAGGITQHIGAFSVPVKMGAGDAMRTITFLDTPGHAAFSAMRARGTTVTDIAVLVVAADDGVMPQTREVIELVKKENGKVGLVVAINKCDKPDANVEKVHMGLLDEGIQLEAIGGDVPAIEVSGLTGQGLTEFVETLSAMAEMLDLHAERDGPVYGFVLESDMQQGLGRVATVLVLRGAMRVGQHIICGTSAARVRLMKDSSGADVDVAYPGMAVSVSGWKTLPEAGDEVLSGTESDIRKALSNRQRRKIAEAALADVEMINVHRREERERRELVLEQEAAAKDKKGRASPAPEPVQVEKAQGPKELRLVIKGDVSGSVEALEGALSGIGNKLAAVKIVSTGVGPVNESDVMLAQTAQGTIVAFSVDVDHSVEGLAAQHSVPIYRSDIIYRVVENIVERVSALLPPTIETKITGEAVVLQLFDINVRRKQTKKVAGCRISNGVIERGKRVKIVRGGEVVHDGPVETIRHLKDEVSEVRKGAECGLSLEGFDDVREGDTIKSYYEIEHPGIL